MYLYLERQEYVETWLNGGEIPLYMASKYKSSDRKGVNTPDEVIQRQSEGMFDQKNFNKIINLENAKGKIKIKIGLVQLGNEIIGENISINQNFEDVLLFCVSTELSNLISRKLNKPYCVEIIDFQKLKSIMDKQIGIIGNNDICRYTKENNRNHFLKSKEDVWQKEYRIIWKNIKGEKSITIPSGICKKAIIS